MWHVTFDTWHVTHSVMWTFSQNLSSLALAVRNRQCLEDSEQKDEWINQRPAIPLAQRGCRFCGPPGPRVPIGCADRGPVDDEQHAMTVCSFMAAERAELYSEMSQSNPLFQSLNCHEKFVRLMCPVIPIECKLVSRFINKTFTQRKYWDEN